MRTRQESIVSMDRMMLIYCIMEELQVNLGEIICEHILECVKHPYGARSFPHLIEKLCLKTCLALEKLPQVEVKDGMCTTITLPRIIAIHKNKARLKRLKTKKEG
ncbi:hypothetical protein E5676_scaffold602G00710 [Cucumis melo var. makuwa]|uniref:Uncharacterized protein n=2 Tax=Cucumis melo var. makuwa TaxID=1194695 RepID=A0A5D3BPB1_CUCMM|nr:hypothetical protein E5676_scaffold602G00710 [Cucumis melo var. makuwa]